jgi:molybdopterin synthase catalytic subunit/molybdopterin synthase sulfur carrier subunit
VRIKVRYFASIRDWTGLKEETLEVPEGCTADQLRRIVVSKHNKLEIEDTLLVAVEGAFVDRNRVLNPLEEVALFPPVSGG